MTKKNAMMFHGLELNKRMRQNMSEEEVLLFRHIRRCYADKVLQEPSAFSRIVEDIQRRIDDVNLQRRGVGPYLALDAFAPTDITIGWIRLHHVMSKAQARMVIVTTEGDIVIPE